MAIQLKTTQAIHSNGRPFSESLLHSEAIGPTSKSSAGIGGSSLISATSVPELSVKENTSLGKRILEGTSPDRTPNPTHFFNALKELQSQLIASKSELATLDPDSDRAKSMETECASLQKNIANLQQEISLRTSLHENSNALRAA